MADQGGLDLSKVNVYGASDEQLSAIQEALQKNISALEQRYSQPNWFKVAAGFAKPQLGGFIASLGSANEALGETVEKQREAELPIAQMRSQLAQSNLLLSQNKKAADLVAERRSKGLPITPDFVGEIMRIAPSSPLAQSLSAELGTQQKQQEITANIQRNALTAAAEARQQGLEVDPEVYRQAGLIPPGAVAEGAPKLPSPDVQLGDQGRTGGAEPIIPRIESGNKPDAVNPRSGAKGAWQVMPNTLKDPGYGVTPAQNDSPEELARVGKDYWEAMRQKYSGNDTAAAVAYNWGPDNADKWIKSGAKWNDLPKETRDYLGQYSLLRDMPEAKAASEDEAPKSKIMLGKKDGFSVINTKADVAKLQTASDEKINEIYSKRFEGLADAASPETYSSYNAAISSMIDTIKANPKLAAKVVNPLAQFGGVLGGLLNAAQAGLGVGVAGFAGNVQLPVLKTIVGSFNPEERKLFEQLSSQAARISQIQQSQMNVNPGTIRNGEIELLKNTNVNPANQGVDVMLYGLYYTKLQNEMLHDMYSKANSILNNEDKEYQLNPNSRTRLKDVLSSPAMESISNNYEKRFQKLNADFNRSFAK